MKLENNDQGQVVGPCEDCGLPGHAHDKKKVADGGGYYHYEYECPGSGTGILDKITGGSG